jgi:hypothetical protein
LRRANSEKTRFEIADFWGADISDSAAAGNRASLSSRVVEKAAASEQSKGRQQKR